MDFAEQTVASVLVTYYENVKKIFVVVYCNLFSVYAKLALPTFKFTLNIGLHITPPFVFLSDVFCWILTQLHGHLRQVLKIFKGEREEAKLTLCFSDVIISVIMSALKKVHRQIAYRLLKGSGKIPGYFCLIS